MKFGSGECAKCGKSDLQYGLSMLEDEMLYYPYTCSSCGHEGQEWYNLEYAESI